MQCLDTVKESDTLAKLEVGAVKSTAREAIIGHLNMERANDMKGVGIKSDRVVDNMTEST